MWRCVYLYGTISAKMDFGYGDMYVYKEAGFEANQVLQEPLEKLFEYERLDDEGKMIKLPYNTVWYIVDQGTFFATVMSKDIKDLRVYEIEKIDVDSRYWSTEEEAIKNLRKK